jgi:hypothetical protein
MMKVEFFEKKAEIYHNLALKMERKEAKLMYLLH